MNSFLILVKEKTLYVHFEAILKKGKLIISNEPGETVFQKMISDSHYEIVNLKEPEGKYWIIIDAGQKRLKKSFQIK